MTREIAEGDDGEDGIGLRIHGQAIRGIAAGQDGQREIAVAAAARNERRDARREAGGGGDHGSGDPELETRSSARARLEDQVGIQRTGATLQTRGAEPQQFEFFQVVRAREGEAVAVIVNGNLQAAIRPLERDGDARRAGVLLNIVERLAKHLEQLERRFRRKSDRAVGPDERHRNAALFLKCLGGAARRRDQVRAIHVDGPHAVEERAEVADLSFSRAPVIV